MAMPNRHRKRAFTLVELLVVIGIIAVLLSIALPAMGHAREQARRTVCLSNLRQLTLAWITYSNEHGGRLVSAYTWGPESWVNDCTVCMSVEGGALWQYTKNPHLYVCPDDPLNYDRTYAINAYLNGEAEGAAKTMSGIRQPSSGVFCFMEKYDPRGLNEDSFVCSVYPSTQWVDTPAPWHGNAGCISFCDGHAIVWSWSDGRTGRNHTPGSSEPTNYDLKQLQTWYGPNPTPPGVGQ
jgi:prepilin-type N-terminal cleavage/methylation domain-containing protein